MANKQRRVSSAHFRRSCQDGHAQHHWLGCTQHRSSQPAPTSKSRQTTGPGCSSGLLRRSCEAPPPAESAPRHAQCCPPWGQENNGGRLRRQRQRDPAAGNKITERRAEEAGSWHAQQIAGTQKAGNKRAGNQGAGNQGAGKQTAGKHTLPEQLEVLRLLLRGAARRQVVAGDPSGPPCAALVLPTANK